MSSNHATSLKSSATLSVLVFAGFIIAYFPVAQGLVHSWSQNEEYSQGFLVLPLVLLLIWQKRRRIAETESTSSLWGLFLLIAGLLLYLLGHFAEIKTVTSLSMIPVIVGVILYLYGIEIFKELIFPVFILLFMIPIPSQIFSSLTIPLQLLVSKVSVYLAFLMQIPIHRAGNVIYLPHQTLEVVRACSGLRSVLAILFVSTVFAYFTLTSNKLRMVLALSGIPAAIVVNIIRVLCVIMFSYYFKLDLSRGAIHTLLGVVVFALVLLFVGLIRWILSNWDISADQKA